jgi:hypothetical protein
MEGLAAGKSLTPNSHFPLENRSHFGDDFDEIRTLFEAKLHAKKQLILTQQKQRKQ